jgi:hypothetical protein
MDTVRLQFIPNPEIKDRTEILVYGETLPSVTGVNLSLSPTRNILTISGFVDPNKYLSCKDLMTFYQKYLEAENPCALARG